MKYYASFDIGGTSIKYGIIEETGAIVEDFSTDTQAQKGGFSVVEKVKQIIADFHNRYTLSGICISTAGMVDTQTGEILFSGPQIPEYTGINWKKELGNKIPCEVENDVNCAGLAEVYAGAAKGSKNCLCLTIGTGIGGCAIIENKILHGAAGAGCEVGYIHMHGTEFQELASTTALCRAVAKRKGWTIEETNGKRIFEQAKQGDSICQEEINKLICYLSEGIADICYVLNPDTVVLGGGITAQAQYLESHLKKELEKNIIPAVYQHMKVVFAQNQNRAGMLGAFYHFQQRQKKEF